MGPPTSLLISADSSAGIIVRRGVPTVQSLVHALFIYYPQYAGLVYRIDDIKFAVIILFFLSRDSTDISATVQPIIVKVCMSVPYRVAQLK